MFTPSYKDWPPSHRRLFHLTLLLLFLMLLALWFGAFPRWKRLDDLQEHVQARQEALEKHGVILNADLLRHHIQNCKTMLKGDGTSKGLETVVDQLLLQSANTFRDDIYHVYASHALEGDSPEAYFVKNATRLDYKDLYDRLSSDFVKSGILLSQDCLEEDKENTEPVFHLMLKLWTIQKLLNQATACQLTVANNADGHAAIAAERLQGYIIGNSTEPYLLECPIRIRLHGTMEQFIAFAEAIQSNSLFLPVKFLRIFSRPPESLSASANTTITQLEFQLVCSSFFPLPAEQNRPQSNHVEKEY